VPAHPVSAALPALSVSGLADVAQSAGGSIGEGSLGLPSPLGLPDSTPQSGRVREESAREVGCLFTAERTSLLVDLRQHTLLARMPAPELGRLSALAQLYGCDAAAMSLACWASESLDASNALICLEVGQATGGPAGDALAEGVARWLVRSYAQLDERWWEANDTTVTALSKDSSSNDPTVTALFKNSSFNDPTVRFLD